MIRQITDADLTLFELELIEKVRAALQMPMPERKVWFAAVTQAADEASREQAARDWRALVDQCARTERVAA